MRRVVPILLVLFLVPSSVAASWYTCMYDKVTRSACCCATRDDASNQPAQPEQRPAGPETVLRAACCCTVTHVASAPAMDRVNPSLTSASIDAPPVVLAIAAPVPVPPSRATAPIARPCAQDPPGTLFSRRCLLLL